MSQLKHYTARAKQMSAGELIYAISDIKATWEANPDFQDPATEYGQKLWAEWDAYTVELQKRRS